LNDCRSDLQRQGVLHLTLQKNSKWKCHSKQNGVLRTNCMDCLDRTNVVQTLFARHALFQSFNDKQVIALEDILAFKNNPMTLPWVESEECHRLLWADNADSISTLYAGTNALKREYTRFGTRTVKGQMEDGVNSLTRYYKNNFEDAWKQLGIDLLVGERGFSFVNPDADDNYIDLNWIPGDLKMSVVGGSHRKSRQYYAEQIDEDMTILHTDALMEIDRRAKSDGPWWVIDSDDELVEGGEGAMGGVSGAQVLLAIVAVAKAPLSTATAILCSLLPGLFSDAKKSK